MSLQQTIAHYLITAKLGEGGMGAVYRATDTKLGREVAIKVIPEAFARDVDRMVRFTREAQRHTEYVLAWLRDRTESSPCTPLERAKSQAARFAFSNDARSR